MHPPLHQAPIFVPTSCITTDAPAADANAPSSTAVERQIASATGAAAFAIAGVSAVVAPEPPPALQAGHPTNILESRHEALESFPTGIRLFVVLH